MNPVELGRGTQDRRASRATLIVGLYAALALLGLVVGAIRGDRDLYRRGATTSGKMLPSRVLGLAGGLPVFFASRLCVHRFDWARRLHRDFRGLLGALGPKEVLLLAVASSVGEELL